MTDTTYIELVVPVPPQPEAHGSEPVAMTSLSRDTMAGRRVSIVDNQKSNALELMLELRHLLVSSFGASPGIVVTKEVSGPLGDGAIVDLQNGSDLVLVGSAD